MSRHALVVGAFAASLLAVLVTPLCTRDRVRDGAGGRGGDAAAWVAAVQGAVDGAVKPAELVLVHPPWRDDVARALVARGIAATVALAPRHGDVLPPLVVVTDSSAPLPRVLADAVDDDDTARIERGGITVARLRPRAATAATVANVGGRSLLDELRAAEVQLRSGGEIIACPWDALVERHVCKGQPEWQHVGLSELPVGGKKVRCAWAHPKTDAVLSVRFPHARVLDQLELSLALTDGAADNLGGAPVRAVLLVDGTEAATLTKKAGARGFAKAMARTTPGDADVELRITTDNDGQRHTCFLLETRGGS